MIAGILQQAPSNFDDYNPAINLLGSTLSQRLTNLDDLQSYIQKRFVKSNIDVECLGHLDARYNCNTFSSINVNYLSLGSKARLDCEIQETFYTIHLPYQGEQRTVLDGDSFISDKNAGVIVSPYCNTVLEMSADCVQRVVKIPKRLVERQLTELLGRNLTSHVRFEPNMDNAGGLGTSWWQSVAFLENELHKPISLFSQGNAAKEMEKMLVTGLLYGQPHNYSEALEATEAAIAPAHVRRAEKYINEFLTESITVEDIVAAANVPKRTLYDGFKRFRGLSPMCYLRNLRLEKTREDLQNIAHSGSITSVATMCGFNHLGRFSGEYKKRFGESPSETLIKKLLLQSLSK